MKKLHTLKWLVLFCFTLGISSSVCAQAPRTWVSATGDDSFPCSRTAPCKTFTGAFIKTATGGEISVIDPGGYGALTITKAITIDGGTGAGWGSALASGVSGFTINISTGLASDKVILRNLSINGLNAPGGFHGIRFLDGAELVVQNVEIFNFTGSGISISQSQTSKTTLDHVRIDQCNNGLTVSTSVGEAIVMARNLSIQKFTSSGVSASLNVRLALMDSVIAHGLNGIATTSTNSIINVDDVFVSYCSTAISGSGSGSSINVSDSILAQNATALLGTVHSFQGNSLINNTTPGAFITTTLKQ